MIVCGGVEIQGLHSTVAPRRGIQAPATLEEYSFVPNTDNVDVFPSDLKKYTQGCLNYILENLKIVIDQDKNGALQNKKILQKILSDTKPSGSSNISSLVNIPNSGLAQTLEKVFTNANSNNLKENIKNLLNSSRSQLSSDCLLSSLSHENILKPCLDIVLENLSTNKPSVFEVGAASSALYRTIIPLITSHPLKNVNYIGSDSVPLDKDAKSLGVKSSQWTPDSSSVPPGKMHLLVLKNVLHKQTNIDDVMKNLSEMISPEGFILVEEVTKNYPLHLALDALSESLPSFTDGVCRMCGRYLTEDSWVEVFTKHGYEIVYKKSDDLLSTMFLLRKKFSIPVKSLVFIDDLQYSWLEDLKLKVKELDTAPETERLWIAAKENINGLAGFITCLRTEAGGSKIRSILISNFKSSSRVPAITVDSNEFQQLVQKDLVSNVFRDGQWGTFRHLPLSKGKNISSLYYFIKDCFILWKFLF